MIVREISLGEANKWLTRRLILVKSVYKEKHLTQWHSKLFKLEE